MWIVNNHFLIFIESNPLIILQYYDSLSHNILNILINSMNLIVYNTRWFSFQCPMAVLIGGTAEWHLFPFHSCKKRWNGLTGTTACWNNTGTNVTTGSFMVTYGSPNRFSKPNRSGFHIPWLISVNYKLFKRFFPCKIEGSHNWMYGTITFFERP